METDELIRQLAAGPKPVRRVLSPCRRALLWLAIALPFVALVVIAMSPRPDLAAKLSNGRFLTEEVAALATALTAAVAAFCSVVPGHDRRLALLPVLPLAVWLGSLGEGCLQSWLVDGASAWQLSLDWRCLPAIAVTGAAPAIAMVAMLRRGAPLSPRISVLLGGLAAAALGNVGLRLFHPQDASFMVLIWQFGSVALLSALAASGGTRILGWAHVGRA